MYCTKCGRKGFPVRLACLKCNAALPGLPAALDTPNRRKQSGEPVICQNCGAVASDARIACLGCDQSFPRPFTFHDYDPEFENAPGIAYFVIRCYDEACDACKEMDGVCFTPEHLPRYRMPIKTCKNAACWCAIFGIDADSEAFFSYDPDGTRHALGGQPAVEFAELLRRFGGVSTDPRAVAYFEAQEAARQLERERSDLEHAAWGKFGEAYAREKDHPEEAVSLYREGVQLYKGLAEKYAVGLDWCHLDYIYDRLMLVLARCRKEEEALSEVAAYRAFGREAGPMSVTWEAILKREQRLKRALSRKETGA